MPYDTVFPISLISLASEPPSPCDNKQSTETHYSQSAKDKKKMRVQKNSTEWHFIISTLSEVQKQGNGVTYLIIPLAGVELCIRMGADLGPSQSDRLQTGREMLRAHPPPVGQTAGGQQRASLSMATALGCWSVQGRQQCGKWPKLTAIRWTSTAAALSVMQIQ